MGLFSRITTSWNKSSRLQELQQIISPPNGSVDDLVSDFRRSLAGGMSAKTRALEEFFDLCESDVGVKNVMAVEHLSRSDLKRLHARLLFAGFGWIEGHHVALSTLAYVEPLQYLVRAQKQEVGWAEICFNLLEYWEGRIPQGELLRRNNSAPPGKIVTSTTETASTFASSPNNRINYSFSAPTISWGASLSSPQPQNKPLESVDPGSLTPTNPGKVDCLTLPSGDRLTQSRMRAARASLPPTRTTQSRMNGGIDPEVLMGDSKPTPMDCLTLPSGYRLTRSDLLEAHRLLPRTRTTRSRTMPTITPEQKHEIQPAPVRTFDAAFRPDFKETKLSTSGEIEQVAMSLQSNPIENHKMQAFENKLTVRKSHYVMPSLPPELANTEGIITWSLVIDPKVGTETCLLLLDRTPFINTLSKVRPFDLRLKSGLVRTDHGPIFFLLFYVPDPDRPGEVFTAIDVHVNPCDPLHMIGWRDLARQSHWHLILLGFGDKLVDLFEFLNTFELGKTLDQVEAVCEKLPHGSFDDAKAEFCATYTLDDLMQLQ
jgi:hypothetical protein